ncbi:VOC family protein [Virgibacillus halophilus]|uniref:VOC family protein n=1 Tax=Tigheibacillus halophilus TaxID=361280 RepID=A0ABU5C4F2_9BACI|nr:VOC family protein [Virgibacillus halophilus]
MTQSNITRGIDHIGITVPDMEEATHFFKHVFHAKIAYDNMKPGNAPQAGPAAEKVSGIPKGAKAIHIRLLLIGRSATIELFQFENTRHREPLHANDYGLQHMAAHLGAC